MNEVREILIDSVSGSFWRFLGYLIMFWCGFLFPSAFAYGSFKTVFKYLAIKKHGYPPEKRNN